MNRIWEIRERRKDDEYSHDDYRGGMMKSRRGKMSGYKDTESYKTGYKEGYCDALDELESFLEEHSSK